MHRRSPWACLERSSGHNIVRHITTKKHVEGSAQQRARSEVCTDSAYHPREMFLRIHFLGLVIAYAVFPTSESDLIFI